MPASVYAGLDRSPVVLDAKQMWSKTSLVSAAQTSPRSFNPPFDETQCSLTGSPGIYSPAEGPSQ